jgi:methyl coenzyme M reductase subunit D
LPAWGRKEKAKTEIPDLGKSVVGKIGDEGTEAEITALVQVTGIVRLVGGGPIPEIVITGPDKEWYVSREDDHLLKELQHQTVTVEGYESVTELRFANGLYAGQRRTLKDIKIIAIEN